MKITNEVLLEKLENLIKSNADEHKRILEQTTKTNGNVSNLQIFQATQIEKNKSLKTLISILIAIGILIVGLFLWHLTGYKI
jgi:hypothetical protein